MVRGFKGGLTMWCKQNGHGCFGWQRSYYDHIVRDHTKELEGIREYIITNPVRWELDRENPYRIGVDELEDWIFEKSVRR